MNFDLQSIAPALTYVSFHLTKALTAFMQRDSLLHWPFLLSALVLTVGVAAYGVHRSTERGQRTWWAATREHFSKALWWHASSRADYRLYLANALLLPALFGVLLFSEAHIVNAIDAALGRTPAAPAGAPGASVLSRVVFTIVFFVAYDFGRFVAHSLLHDVPLLWEFHKVHHSAERLTPVTTFRAHPLDLLVMAWVPALTTGLATWVFNQFVASPITFYSFLGLHALVFAFNLVGILRHSEVWLSYGPRWGRWLISPAHHQLHHSCEAKHLGCNRGFEFAVWDRLYGTLYVPDRKETFRMGVGDDTDGQWHTVRRMYWWPFVNAARRIFGSAPARVNPPPSQPSA